MENDRIIRRVKRLLKLAEGKANMEESHAAFLQAQQMMVKHGVDPSEITNDEEVKEVLMKGGTNYKRLFWWERRLALIIAKNYRCKSYIDSKVVKGKSQIQRKMMFMGTVNDVELAEAMYRLALDAIQFYGNSYIKEKSISGNRAYTVQKKNDYMKGFIDGLAIKFDEQISNQEWGLVLAVPKEVEMKYKEFVTGKSLTYYVPKTESHEDYKQGFEDGYSIDYKKETINDNVYQY